MATSETKKLQETIDELKERIERLEKENANLKGKTSWAPGRSEEYYIIEGGMITRCINVAQTPTDLAVEAGNCFKTEADAQEFLAWLKARKTLLDDTKGFKPDWEDIHQIKAIVYYDIDVEEFDTDSHFSNNNGENIWFETEEDAKESIEKHEKEWRIYMGLPAKKDDNDE